MDFIKCTNLVTGKQKLYASIIVRNHAMRSKIGLIVSDPNYDANGNKIEPTLIKDVEPVPVEIEVVKKKETKTNKKK